MDTPKKGFRNDPEGEPDLESYEKRPLRKAIREVGQSALNMNNIKKWDEELTSALRHKEEQSSLMTQAVFTGKSCF